MVPQVALNARSALQKRASWRTQGSKRTWGWSVGYQRYACRKLRYALKSGSWSVWLCSLLQREKRRAGGCEMLVKLRDTRLRSAGGIYAHRLAVPSCSCPPHPSFLLIPPTCILPFSISMQALATPYPSEIDPDSLCLSLCLDRPTHPLYPSTWQEARLASTLVL